VARIRVKLLHSISSIEGWAYAHGQVADVPDELARKWIEGGIAQRVDAPREAAAVVPPERAVQPPAAKRGGVSGARSAPADHASGR
jgi:hypothetical protein